MQLLKRSVATLTLSALVIGLLPMQSYTFNNPFDSSGLRANGHAIGALALLTLPFVLLHAEKDLPDCIRNNKIFKTVIGKPKYTGQKTFPSKEDPSITISRETTTQKAEGFFGHLDNYIKKVLKGFAAYEGLDRIVLIALCIWAASNNGSSSAH